MALVDIVADGAGGSPRALADRDGNRLAIGQCDDDRAAGNRCAYGGGVEDNSAFCHGRRGGQGDSGGVSHIGNGGAHLALVCDQTLVIAAGHGVDAIGDRCMALVNVVGDCSSGGGRTLPDRDGDGLAVGQGDHDGRTCDRCGNRGGVDNGPALGHGWRGGQADSRSIDGVGDAGHCWRVVDRQILEVTARCVGDARADLAGIEIGIIAMGGNADAAGSLVGGDGDGLAVAQGDGHRRLRGIGQGRGVYDLAAFSHARGR